MKIISVNTSLPKEIQYRGQTVKTGIFKTPVEGRLQVSRMGLATDVQVDRRYHGGQNKAVYSYAYEHYQFWNQRLGNEMRSGESVDELARRTRDHYGESVDELARRTRDHYGESVDELARRTRDHYGTFGENLTTLGLLEEEIGLGDRFRIGTVELVAIQPRMPCYKLGVKMGDMTFPKQFKKQGRHGIYWQVDREGELQTGDEIICLQKNANAPKVNDVWKLCLTDFFDEDLAKRIVSEYPLDSEWREAIEQKLFEV